NGAEMNTYETLHYMKRGFIEQGIILDAEFQVMPNVFIKNNSEINDNRIHHLILCKTGIYLLETKEWNEKLIHGLTKENAGI
ncbi:chromosome segregation protein, partial [Bacillus wiedmannii]